jgi:hypothetical protein
MSEKHSVSTTTATTHAETHEAKAESTATKETKHEATAETKKQVDTALNWDHPKDVPPKDHKDAGASGKSGADLDSRMKAQEKDQEAKSKDISAQWKRDDAAAKDRTASDYKFQAEHAEHKSDRDYYAAQAASAKGDAADYRRGAAQDKAEGAELRASASEIRSEHASDKAEAASQKEAAGVHHKDANAWRAEGDRQRDDSFQKKGEAVEIRMKGVEGVAAEKGYVKPPEAMHDTKHDVKKD